MLVGGVIVALLVVVGYFIFKGVDSGPTVGTKDTLPDAMRNAYQKGPGAH